MKKGVALHSNNRLIGSGREKTVLVASSGYVFTATDALVYSEEGASATEVSNLSIDGNGLATYGAGFRNITVQQTHIYHTRCSAVGIAGPKVRVVSNILNANSIPTRVPGRSPEHIGCETVPANWPVNVPYGGVELGAAIYLTSGGDGPNRQDFAPYIRSNEIFDNWGPAIDNSAVWGGTFANNKVYDNSGWAAVSLFGAGEWKIFDNVINHQRRDQHDVGQPYHGGCRVGPAGSRSAGIMLCQDMDSSGVAADRNAIINNTVNGFYGILLIGDNQLDVANSNPRAELTPNLNIIGGNDLNGSNVGCADSTPRGTEASNSWQLNNCRGDVNSSPEYFKLAAQTQEVPVLLSAAYMHELGREPDATGLASFSARILSGSLSVDQASREISSSQEAAFYRKIAAVYLELLGRLPDAAGLGVAMQEMRETGNDALTRNRVQSSAEAKTYLTR